jgi:hypothetical protein
MSIRMQSAAALACVGMLVQVPVNGSQPLLNTQPEIQQETAKPPADMSSRCAAIMADHDRVMTEVQAADQRLDDLVAQMTAASGEDKVDATAAVVTEMVTQRKTMRERMMHMQGAMMSHMMEHMQAGPQSMAMCPMMKMGGMKH